MSLVRKYRDVVLRGFAMALAKKKLEPRSFEALERAVQEGRSVVYMPTKRDLRAEYVLPPNIQALGEVLAPYRHTIAKAIIGAVKKLEKHKEVQKRWEEVVKARKAEVSILREKIRERTYVPMIWRKDVWPAYNRFLKHLRDRMKEIEDLIIEAAEEALEEEMRGKVQKAST